MTGKRGLGKRLSRDFLLQAIYISIAALVGVFAVALLIEDVLTKQALRGEADFIWQRLESEQGIELPVTRNMQTFLDGVGEIPSEYKSLSLGFHRLQSPHAQLAYLTEQDGRRLYLIFQSRQVNELVLAFGLLPLTIVLIVIYLSLFLAYRASHRAMSPVIALAGQVQKLDPSEPNPELFPKGDDRADEIVVLSGALRQLAERLGSFSERERNFTRDASHELRSPLTIIRLAARKLEDKESLSSGGSENLKRIRKAAKEMEELTEAFLLLARESAVRSADEWVSLKQISMTELEKAKILTNDKSVKLLIDIDEDINVAAPEKVVASVIGNLIRNAAKYTVTGSVTVSINGSCWCVEDTGPGIEKHDLDSLVMPFFQVLPDDQQRGGHGVGLTIVKRLTDQFKWPLSIQSEPGIGTRVQVDFKAAVISS